MLGISDRGERADLANTVHIKRLPRFLHNLNYLRPRDSIPDAEAGQSVNLRKRAQQNDVSTVSGVAQRVRRIIQEFKISFIQDDHNPIWYSGDELVHFLRGNQRPSWIVWIGDEDDLGPRRDRL